MPSPDLPHPPLDAVPVDNPMAQLGNHVSDPWKRMMGAAAVEIEQPRSLPGTLPEHRSDAGAAMNPRRLGQPIADRPPATAWERHAETAVSGRSWSRFARQATTVPCGGGGSASHVRPWFSSVLGIRACSRVCGSAACMSVSCLSRYLILKAEPVRPAPGRFGRQPSKSMCVELGGSTGKCREERSPTRG